MAEVFSVEITTPHHLTTFATFNSFNLITIEMIRDECNKLDKWNDYLYVPKIKLAIVLTNYCIKSVSCIILR